jgi:hypothetical protein
MRPHIRKAAVALSLLAAPAASTAAQAPVVVAVNGVAFDSLRGQPLRDAVIKIIGIAHTTTTDQRGRFRFDSVTPGVRTFIVQHPAIDSAGFPGMSRRAPVSAASTEVRLALPSFQTLWRAACGGQPPSDSGFVYGTISDVRTREPVADAAVEVSWIVTAYDKMRGIKQRRVYGETRTDANGGYVVCGVPASHWLKVISATPQSSGGVDIPPGELRIQRRDLMIGPTAEQDSSSTGSIVGLLTDQDGVPFSEARIQLDDSTEARSAGDGRFAFRNVQAGTRQVEVMSIGMVPVVMAVDVFPRDSATITLQLRRVTTLDVVRVTASRRGRLIAEGIEERRKLNTGYSMDMTELQAHASFSTVMNDFPGVRVQQSGGDYRVFLNDGRGGQCTPDVWVDGARMAVATLVMIRPRDVLAVEYYPRATSVPFEFRARSEQYVQCGVIAVWTNWAVSR